ncbi:MAG: S8 family serine peptidase [Caldimicrobium sp.]
MKRLIGILIFFVFLWGSLGYSSSGGKELPYKEDEVLVKFRPEATREIQALSEPEKAVIKKLEASKIDILKVEKIGNHIGPVFRLKFDKKRHSVEEVINILKKHRDIEYVEPNYKIKINKLPNEYNISYWWIDRIGLPQAWDLTTGSEEIVVAVVDTGVDYTHEDLAGNMWQNLWEIPGNGIDDDGNGYVDDVYGINAILDNGDPMDDDGHGTHVAGIIGAVGNNGLGVVGVNWKVKILACKFLGLGGSGYLSDELKCFNYILQMKNKGVNIRAVNMSFGSSNYSYSAYNSLKALSDKGIILVAAAGNDGTNNDINPFYPCNYNLENLICVAASDNLDNLAYFSNYGNSSVHLAAPGVFVKSTYAMDSDYILSNLYLAQKYFFDDFENGGQNWSYQEPSGINQEFYKSPVSSLAFVKEGNYPNNQVIELTSFFFNLSQLNDPLKKVFVSFYYYPLMSDLGDTVKMLYGRGDSWKTIIEVNGLDLWSYYGEWVNTAFYVPVDFRRYDFRVKFSLETNYSDVDRRVFFDDFGIYVLSGPTRNYAPDSGTSMATPFVTGAVALAWSKNPGLSAQEVKGLLLNNVDVFPQFSGKVKTSGRLNVAKLLSAVSPPPPPCTQPFIDVPCDYWAFEAIKWAKDNGVSTGWPDGTFRPEEPVTRSAMAAFIIRAKERTNDPLCNGSIPCQNTQPYFKDVDPSYPFYKHIQKLYELGITKGYDDGTYRPEESITRQAMAAFLVRAKEGTDEPICQGGIPCSQTTPYFQDVPQNHPFFRHIQRLKELGITKGCNSEGTLFCPDRAVTRAEMAVFLCRMYGNCPK